MQGSSTHLVEITGLTAEPEGRLSVSIRRAAFKHQAAIEADPELKQLATSLPRSSRPLDSQQQVTERLSAVDLVICALGFEDSTSLPLVANSLASGNPNLLIAGDAAAVEPAIIVGAQASAKNSYQQIRTRLIAEPSLARSSWFGATKTHENFSRPLSSLDQPRLGQK